MGDFLFRLRDFFRYSNRELKDLFITILIVTFAFAYDDKNEIFVLDYWIFNFIKIFFLVLISFFVYTSFQKMSALSQGFIAEYRAWSVGLAITFIFTILTQGKLYLLLMGGLVLYHVSILRLGKFRYGENINSRGLIAASGAIGNLVLATFSLAMSAQLNIMPELFNLLAVINFWLMIYSLLPIPKHDGIHLFFMSRLTYVFIFSTLLAYVLLTRFEIYSWIFSLLIGTTCWFLYYAYLE
ncbi:MAG: hypothetical protein ACLFPJ_04360 [Candidatus Woesearchaeota archaeon]